MKLFFLLWILIASCFAGYAQDDPTSNFITGHLLKSKAADSELYFLWYQSEIHNTTAPDSALVFAQKGLAFARELKFEEGEALCILSIAKIFMNIGNYSKSLQTALQSLDIFERINVPSEKAINLYFIAEVFNLQGDYRQSLLYDQKARVIAESIHEKKSLIQILSNIGHDYEQLNQLDSAIFYANQGYALCDPYADAFMVGKALSLLGDIYTKSGNLTLAMSSYRLSLVYSGKIKDVLGSGILKDNLALANANLGIAVIYKKENKPDSCLYYAKRSLQIASQRKFTRQILNAAQFLADYYQDKKIFDSAFAYQHLSIQAKDSLFSAQKILEFQNISFSEQMRQQELKEEEGRYRSRISIYILFGAIAAILVIVIILLRNNRQKQKANELLNEQKQEIGIQKTKAENALEDLQLTQAQLIQAEKMASLGELTAGIAHEIQNPLNFVNNFSEVNKELIEELEGERAKGNGDRDEELENDILKVIKKNEEKINHHGKRADAIVKGMLLHSRSGIGVKESTDINGLADEYLRLAYHGLRTKDNSFHAIIKTDFDDTIGKINIVPQDIARVLVNLYNNAFYAVHERRKLEGQGYEPTISISTRKINEKVFLTVMDNGNGIPQKVVDKIFQPFFTTKPTGQGTGLGLSLSYDIIKAHGGEIKVETKENKWTQFMIELPF